MGVNLSGKAGYWEEPSGYPTQYGQRNLDRCALGELLELAGVRDGSVQVQFQGLETGPGPGGFPSNVFLKSLDFTNTVLDQCIVA